MKLATYLKPLPNPLRDNVTKGELAEARLGDITFDSALPQTWLNEYVSKACANVGSDARDDFYCQIVSQCVTVYPPGNYFGEIVNLITGEILS